MKRKMTGKELQEMIASGAIIINKGRYVASASKLIDYGAVPKQKAAIEPTPLKPVEMKGNRRVKNANKSNTKVIYADDEIRKIFDNNKRVKNANKVIIDDIKFDSKLEAYMYGLLKKKKINFEMQKVFVLQPGFRDTTGKAIIAIKWKADFWLPDHGLIIDTKGWGTEIFKIKLKLFKYQQNIGNYSEVKTLEFPSNKSKCLLLSVSL